MNAFRVLRRLALLLLPLLVGVSALAAAADDEKAQTIIHMLDYVGVDYPDTVRDGRVQDAGEYQEQREFAGQVVALLEQLPPVAGKDALLQQARALLGRINAKAPGGEVSGIARTLGAELVRLYGVAVAPRQAPDLARAATLFQAQCAACHGPQGRGDGPAAKDLDPAPSNFHDAARMDKRSVYGLYNTVTLGVRGTPMRAFTELPEADRWALAFLVAGLRHAPERQAQGEALWRQGVGKAEMGDLRRLVTTTPAEQARTNGPDLGAVQAYLLAHPATLAGAGPAPLVVARQKLAEALAAYRGGDRAAARQLGITAYLEGFELVEAGLDNVDPGLRQKIEQAMMAVRSDIDAARPVAALEARVQQALTLLDEADRKLAEGEMSPATAFTSSLLILLREGLEAILVLAAIIAFVRKTGRTDALPYIHAGWVAAVLLGVATWFAANRFLSVSGASRELTEGFSALLAAGMLLYVGLWLHNRSHAQAWQTFIRDQVAGALAKRTLWAMASISFLAVYRELFEIILFYETLLAQAGEARRPHVLGGIGASLVLLALFGGLILKYSVRLPIGLFFAATSWLLVLMAVIFVGHGIAALQEAGLLTSTPIDFVAVPLLGVHPNLQGLAAQGAMLALTVCALLMGRRAPTRQPGR
ncbi:MULTISPECIES: cytochrome c/FTR1 family iron permease [Ramlibacter]|uniref:C-type cytochrome n=1 Tax=Ramlibacter pinisoli TaxID=2682844 RepID=A0A6N8IRA2_9BURK|nr:MULTISPECIES: cytochrome c/FTR1 family iron permease [Ramlibacter]MBA2964483.1 FTR1 family protein [Ramlibacter sp. CGMCC 1.13660]MVQ29449.1 c-type cytochrome [Ramlibacter pinisoli]